jgi:ADP-ribose pyrophosphatase YjhB (NUDIX family)
MTSESLPKGWPMTGRKYFDAAAIEAKEEAGVRGKISKRAIGTYRYFKRQKDHFELVRVHVYPLKVDKELKAWPGHKQRKVNWWSLANAVVLADEPGVASVPLQVAAKPGGKAKRKRIEAQL